jgi:cytochrome c oxidase assembly protein subunit 15
MWAVGYVGRLPALQLPSPLLLVLMLAVMVGGGLFLGRHRVGGFREGVFAGAISGLLNLLVLGSFLRDPHTGGNVPSALIWIPFSVVLSAALVGIGGHIGERHLTIDRPFADWTAGLVRVAVVATLLLLAVGGLVTSTDSGLAVVDWPNSFGYNMFLYPFSRMTGGIYYEHAHRLFGALVGLTTLVTAVVLQLSDDRAWIRRLGWGALLMVIVQGLLGGLRVTGGLTLSTSPEAMRPSLALAMVHGVLGQLFFATLVALAAFTSHTWRESTEVQTRRSVAGDRIFGLVLIGAVIGQLVLGAAQRHFQALLIVHMITGVGLVAPVALHVGLRAWATSPDVRLLRRLGLLLMSGLGLQVLLGFAAYGIKGAVQVGAASPVSEVTVATLHQWVGAMILATAVLTTCWTYRLVRPSAEA